jgi:hypothetical protein
MMFSPKSIRRGKSLRLQERLLVIGHFNESLALIGRLEDWMATSAASTVLILRQMFLLRA